MIKEINNGFEIYHKEKLFLKHSINEAGVFFGKKELDISMKNGEFDITDNTKFIAGEYLETKGNDIYFKEGKIVLKEENDNIIFDLEKIQVPIRLKIESDEDERIYGMGEHFTKLNLRGQIIKNWVEEHITRKQIYNKILRKLIGLKPKKWKFEEYKTYFIDPTYLSSANYYLSVDTDGLAYFDFTNKSFHQLTIYSNTRSIILSQHKSFLEANQALCKHKGKMPRLPEWIYDGMIFSIQGGSEVLDKKISKIIKQGGKISSVWAQDWCGELFTFFGKQVFWNWEVDKTLYPKLKEYIKKWDALGVNFLAYINPYLNANGEMFQYALENNYLVKTKDNTAFLTKATSFDFGIVDLTYNKAYDWFKNIIKTNYIDLGIKGWMADFGEYLPTDCVLYKGSGEDLHNLWPDIWIKLNREVLEENKMLGKTIFFNRAGYKDNIKYSTLIWNGDQHVDFTDDFGMGSVTRAALSLSMSGVGISHSDIGGYTTVPAIKRSKELYLRWLEMNTFTPVMRSHEGNKPWVNIQFDSDEDIIKQTVKFTNVHSLLKPYFQAVENEYQDNNIPMIRPLFYYYPIQSDQAFLIGEDLYVNPVIKKKVRKMRIEIPEGNWIHIMTGTEYSKGHHFIETNLGCPPVFYKKTSVYKNIFEAVTCYLKNKDVG